mmetsp:Transcript_23114/g.22533  ORF Transcript_23114/g.22533 Transcript_23114/m.22533 type:complete len:154 (-) Transcript_23114:219-680(-)
MLLSLWEELASIGNLLQNDQEIFYRWLRDCIDLYSDGIQVIHLSTLIAFFKEIVENQKEQLKFINLEGFNCIQSMFILMNVEEKKMIKLGWACVQNTSNSGGSGGGVMAKLTSYGNTKGGSYDNFSFTQNKRIVDSEELEISNLVHPEDLEGI